MALYPLIEQQLRNAMKAKEAEKVSALRMLKAALVNFQIEKGQDQLNDGDVLDVVQRLVKQRRESFQAFKQAGRHELAAREEAEIALLQSYLPSPLTDEELRTFVEEAIRSANAKTKADLGRVMKELMPQVKGRADGKHVNEIVLSFLS